MIIDSNPKDMPGANGHGREPMHSEDLDRVNEAAKNLGPVLGIAAPCHRQPVLLVGYKPKEKTIILSCPVCQKAAGEIFVKEKGSKIICPSNMIQQ